MDCMGQEKDAYNYRKRLIKTINSISFSEESTREIIQSACLSNLKHTLINYFLILDKKKSLKQKSWITFACYFFYFKRGKNMTLGKSKTIFVGRVSNMNDNYDCSQWLFLIIFASQGWDALYYSFHPCFAQE